MHRTLAKLKSRIAALLVAVLVIVPAADAFACSLEQFDVHLATALDEHAAPSHDDADKADGSGDTHGVCAHGHCHHSIANIPASTTLSHDAACVAQVVLPDAPPASGILEELLRPPRV